MKITEYIDRCILERASQEASAAVDHLRETYGWKYVESLGRAMSIEERMTFENNKASALDYMKSVDVPRYSEKRVEQLRAWVRQLPDTPPDWIIEPIDPKRPELKLPANVNKLSPLDQISAALKVMVQADKDDPSSS